MNDGKRNAITIAIVLAGLLISLWFFALGRVVESDSQPILVPDSTTTTTQKRVVTDHVLPPEVLDKMPNTPAPGPSGPMGPTGPSAD